MVEYSRPSDALERMLIYRNEKRLYTNFSITITLNQHVDAVLLSNALSSMIKKNPWLAYNFYRSNKKPIEQTKGTNYHLTTLEKIRYEDVVSVESIDAFDGTTLSGVCDHKPELDVPRPLWRIKVFETPSKEQYITAYFDHVLHDGVSGVKFQDALIEELCAVESDQVVDVLFDRVRDAACLPNKPFDGRFSLYRPPSFFTRLWYYMTIRHSAVMKIFGYLSSFFTTKPKPEALHPLVADPSVVPPLYTNFPEEHIRSGVRIVNLDATLVEKILVYTRSQGITATPFIQAIAMQLSEEFVYPKINPNEEFSQTCMIPVGGRRYYPDTREYQYGFIATGEICCVAPIKGRTSELMQYLMSVIQKNLITKSIPARYQYWSSLNFMDLNAVMAPGMDPKQRRSLACSNVGSMKESSGKFKATNALFCSDVGKIVHFVVAIMSTKEGGINVVFSYDSAFEDLKNGDRKVMDMYPEMFKERVLNQIQSL